MKYKCTVCGYIYDEEGIDPITGEKNVSWNELPEEWVCPKCSAPKSEFKPIDGEESFAAEDEIEDFDDYTEDTDLDNF